MARKLTEEEFLTGIGTSDWFVVDGVAVGRFATGSFAEGVTFVNAIGRIADGVNHHPDVELTYPQVTVRLVTHDAGDALTDLDLGVAKEISSAAATLGISAK